MKYFYTCPIKAPYMVKEFGVKILGLEQDPDILCEFIRRDFNGPNKFFREGFVVAPESEHIFQPKEGDLDIEGRIFKEFNQEYFESCEKAEQEGEISCFVVDWLYAIKNSKEGKWWQIGEDGGLAYYRFEDKKYSKTAIRNCKQFFMSEIEN